MLTGYGSLLYRSMACIVPLLLIAQLYLLAFHVSNHITLFLPTHLLTFLVALYYIIIGVDYMVQSFQHARHFYVSHQLLLPDQPIDSFSCVDNCCWCPQPQHLQASLGIHVQRSKRQLHSYFDASTGRTSEVPTLPLVLTLSQNCCGQGKTKRAKEKETEEEEEGDCSSPRRMRDNAATNGGSQESRRKVSKSSSSFVSREKALPQELQKSFNTAVTLRTLAVFMIVVALGWLLLCAAAILASWLLHVSSPLVNNTSWEALLLKKDPSMWIGAIATSCIGLVLISPHYVGLLGNYYEFLAFGFMSLRNRNWSLQLKRPDISLEKAVSPSQGPVLVGTRWKEDRAYVTPYFSVLKRGSSKPLRTGSAKAQRESFASTSSSSDNSNSSSSERSTGTQSSSQQGERRESGDLLSGVRVVRGSDFDPEILLQCTSDSSIGDETSCIPINSTSRL